MKRIYISGPISNTPHELAFEAFEDAENKLRARGYEPVNPMKLPHDHDKTWSAYMREDIIALMGCDEVCFLYDSEYSTGAMIEIELAKKLGIPTRSIYSHSCDLVNHG